MTRSWRKKTLQLKLAQQKEVEADENRISELGDDILLSIINRLTLKEATATSVLSTRWKPLHTLISRLNFPPFPCQEHDSKETQYVKNKFGEYIKMINHTLDSYECDRMLKESKVHMYSLKGANMMRWLEFAFAREVETIHIRLEHLKKSKRERYALQLENLISRKSRQALQGLKCLRELSLSKVDVDYKDMLLLLSNSSNLENLSLEHPHMLRNISIVGHLKLQHVSISSQDVESIKIYRKYDRTCLSEVSKIAMYMVES